MDERALPMVLNISAATITASAATEATLGATLASMAAAVAGPLTAALPMGIDLDSLEFAAALNAAGAAFIGAASAHAADRQLFGGAQQIAAATYVAADVINNAALAL